jgi:Transposase
MLAILPSILQLLLAMALLLSLGFTPNIALIISKSSDGHPPKLYTANIHFAQCLISSGKANTAIDVTKALCNVTNQPLHAQTVHHHLKVAGMKAVVKKKRPFLSKKHRKARMDFALAHQH